MAHAGLFGAQAKAVAPEAQEEFDEETDDGDGKYEIGPVYDCFKYNNTVDTFCKPLINNGLGK